jgi:glycosyltransferase involved in cell wall biosynthesis
MRSEGLNLVREPVVSIVLCTYNRSHLIANALDALVAQTADTPPYEVIVVDNNSTDGTRDVVRQVLTCGLVRYEHEPSQGLSAARNHGVAVARSDVIAFTDDDVRVSPTWVRTIVQAFSDHPEVEMVGGKVKPVWQQPPPSWLQEVGDAPLALVDYGDHAFRIPQDRTVCLIGANVAVRRRAFERVGGFSTAVQRVRNGIGSVEDHEFQNRVLAGGASALYDPRMLVNAPVARERLMKQYHRAWHAGHGRFYAVMRDPSFEHSRRWTFLGVPAHVYRSVCREAAGWGASLLARGGAAAFTHELRLRFLSGFVFQRVFNGYDPLR